jgi:hypothetical protein
MKFAMNAPGVSNTSTLNTLLKSVGLKYSTSRRRLCRCPTMRAALKNKSVDARRRSSPARARLATAMRS